jgi:hypothetical protein
MKRLRKWMSRKMVVKTERVETYEREGLAWITGCPCGGPSCKGIVIGGLIQKR